MSPELTTRRNSTHSETLVRVILPSACLLLCAGCSGPGRAGDLNTARPYVGKGSRAWTQPVKKGALTFTAASAYVEGQLHLVLRVCNHSTGDVSFLRRPNEYSGQLVFGHNELRGRAGGFHGGMSTRVRVSGGMATPSAPRFSPNDVLILAPRESVTQWIALGREEGVTALEEVALLYFQHMADGFPMPSFTGEVNLPRVPTCQSNCGSLP